VGTNVLLFSCLNIPGIGHVVQNKNTEFAQIAIVDDERAFLESYTHIVEKLFAKNRIEFVVQ